MKNIEEQLKTLREITLDVDKKAAVRENLVHTMYDLKVSTVRNVGAKRLHYGANIFEKVRLKKQIAVIVASTLFLGVGTSFAAEGTVPGDVLYPMKVHVNEKVQELTALTPNAQVKVQARIAERRLEEVEKLARENRLSTTTAESLEAEFEKHADRSRKEIEKIAEKNGENEAEKARSNIETNFSEHQKILNVLKEDKPRSGEHMNNMLKRIDENAKDLSEMRNAPFKKKSDGVQKKVDEKEKERSMIEKKIERKEDKNNALSTETNFQKEAGQLNDNDTNEDNENDI
jgi:hypothetical protein